MEGGVGGWDAADPLPARSCPPPEQRGRPPSIKPRWRAARGRGESVLPPGGPILLPPPPPPGYPCTTRSGIALSPCPRTRVGMSRPLGNPTGDPHNWSGRGHTSGTPPPPTTGGACGQEGVRAGGGPACGCHPPRLVKVSCRTFGDTFLNKRHICPQGDSGPKMPPPPPPPLLYPPPPPKSSGTPAWEKGVQRASWFSDAPGAFLNPFLLPPLPPNITLLLFLFFSFVFPNGIKYKRLPQGHSCGCRGAMSSASCSEAAGGERG